MITWSSVRTTTESERAVMGTTGGSALYMPFLLFVVMRGSGGTNQCGAMYDRAIWTVNVNVIRLNVERCRFCCCSPLVAYWAPLLDGTAAEHATTRGVYWKCVGCVMETRVKCGGVIWTCDIVCLGLHVDTQECFNDCTVFTASIPRTQTDSGIVWCSAASARRRSIFGVLYIRG